MRPSRGRAIVVAAADHGVVRQGVSAYPSDVTAQMVANFLAGGAAINVLAAAVGADVVVVDVGVAGPDPGRAGPPAVGRSHGARRLVRARIRDGDGGHDRGPGDGSRRKRSGAIAVGLDLVDGARRRRASTCSASARWGSATPRPPAR